MLNEMHPGRGGYQGKDSMRDKAKRMFGSSMSMDMSMPRSRSEKSKEKPRLYARGGEVESAPKMKRGGHHSHRMHHLMHGGEVPNYHDPESGEPHMKRGGHHKRPARPKMHEHHKAHKGPKTPKLNIESPREMENMRRGGHAKKHYNDGGMVGMMGSNPATWSPTVAAKRGGKIAKKRCYNDGGMVNPEPNNGAMALKRGGKASHKHHKEGRYDFGGRVRQAISFARDNAPRAMQLARQYAPQAREAINRFAPRIGQRLQSAYDSIAPKAQAAYGFAKENAPRAQEMIGKFSPGMAERFGQFRNAVGLKKGGKAHHKHHEDHERYAMGGVGKIRHGQATKSGKPINRRVVKGR